VAHSIAQTPWRQVNVEFHTPVEAERTALTHVAPVFAAAEAEGLIDAWFFVRKSSTWRLRYQPADHAHRARHFILDALTGHVNNQHIRRIVEVVYEPETRAFGGTEAMFAAHHLWHHDTRHVVSYLAMTTLPVGRRELSIILYSAMLRAARLDWYEQGDVWNRVAAHRGPPSHLGRDSLRGLESSVRRLVSVDTTALTRSNDALARVAGWDQDFASTGAELHRIAAEGLLRRGLRDVLAHHIIFAWNRLGLDARTQATLATAAATVTFGPDPACPTPPSALEVPAPQPSAIGRRRG
jgi:thiopeptide-type bacteriocin biosynthesis protein